MSKIVTPKRRFIVRNNNISYYVEKAYRKELK